MQRFGKGGARKKKMGRNSMVKGSAPSEDQEKNIPDTWLREKKGGREKGRKGLKRLRKLGNILSRVKDKQFYEELEGGD